MTNGGAKLDWQGEILSVQPRIRLARSFDQLSHSYLGYVLRVRGTLDGEAREFVVAIGKAAQAKHGFRAGDTAKTRGHPLGAVVKRERSSTLRPDRSPRL